MVQRWTKSSQNLRVARKSRGKEQACPNLLPLHRSLNFHFKHCLHAQRSTLTKCFCKLGRRLNISFDGYRSRQRRKSLLEKLGRRYLGCEGVCLCICRCWMRLWKCRLGSAEVTSAPISTSDLQLSSRSPRH